MHFTLHLSNTCNMKCDYCYVFDNKSEYKPLIMSKETAFKAIDIATSNSSRAGIIFFGGEPLLHRELIEDVIKYSKEKQGSYFFKITTNGLLLDESFIDLSVKENIFIAISIDGTKNSHNKHRKDSLGLGTYDRVIENAKRLLKKKPYSPVLMTINPDTVDGYCDGVKSLFEIGFSYIICSLNYAADWTDEDMKKLAKQYELLADFYYEHTKLEDKFYLSPFEVKISSHVNNKTYRHERCELGKRQISIGPDGKLYPCVQFVGDDNYSIGNVHEGIDENKRFQLFNQNEKEKPECDRCAIRERCNHYCGCLNKQATGNIDEVSPVLCAHERIILPIADRVAYKLYKEKNPMFIQKHYNDFYPVVSMVEEKIK
ncbi:MAG: radical SAM protein [Oscillospiraceae bacterium]|nr:radical SAM protein [Oscillospiraceae bacterium]